MSTQYTVEQILQLAPDDASKKSGKGLAKATHWVTSGYNELAIWGECKGSGSNPYQTRIDLQNMAFKCTCPSRKFPCKHAIGLFLLYVQDISVLTQSDDPPDWVADWLAGRAEKQQAKVSKPAKNPAVSAKTQAKREASVQAGLEDINLWLMDLVRSGFNDLKNRPYHFFEQQAKRMIDAKASGVARYLQSFASIVNSGEIDWASNLLMEMAKLHLLLESYKNIEQLDPALQQDIKALIGWSQSKEELADLPAVRDQWFVCGQYTENQPDLVTQRIWLYGQTTGKFALLLNFAIPTNLLSLDRQWLTGATTDAELIFYPSAYPLRALVKNRFGNLDSTIAVGVKQIQAVYQTYQSALSQQCWFNRLPIILEDMRLYKHPTESRWGLQDAVQDSLEIAPQFADIWQLLAASAGAPINVFGEYNGTHFLPLGIWQTYGYQPLNAL
ncbi:hypothetical protein BegalDRAFT_2039 [Beggiatoa alba B18LD]|uniref:SWIM-type domain-containing protein n=1 Tax=Beggiatoa alba B18LD TaxID=395493 RepID=I3CH12_9GAMM|nr:SWIM zinc finger family protein [Beggiatoa alba]EIJ42905.1 hypothetical protein BegalDRAFT_2039 [Beggiatoa alba B18LD]